MSKALQGEYEKALKKRDELKSDLDRLENEKPKDTYTIMVTRDRLAYWQGVADGLKIALDLPEGQK